MTPNEAREYLASQLRLGGTSDNLSGSIGINPFQQNLNGQGTVGFDGGSINAGGMLDKTKFYNGNASVNFNNGLSVGGSANPYATSLQAGYKNGNFSVDANANPYEKSLMLKYGGSF